MPKTCSTVIAVFMDQQIAGDAMRRLAAGGLDLKNFNVIAESYRTQNKPIGNIVNRVKSWGKYGALWGGLWGLFLGGIFLSVPMVGPVVVAGQLAAMLVSAIEGALFVGSLSLLGGALYYSGIRGRTNDGLVMQPNYFLLMAQGTEEEIGHARAILTGTILTGQGSSHGGIHALAGNHRDYASV
jgi:hypothetical protein